MTQRYGLNEADAIAAGQLRDVGFVCLRHEDQVIDTCYRVPLVR
ncbi:MAG TPA: hypothetical protein VKP30_08470 [Polyangiaceae bacterium]|nr:hypothetical protein [Polyangiaceae bacterium]